MPLLPLLILGAVGFVVLSLVSVLWVALWLVAALLWLALPVAMLVLGVAVWRAQVRAWRRWSGPATATPQPSRPIFPRSGNAAFDDYRADTLRRLEEEREKFRAFLQRLRVSRDRAAFDRFMAERRGRSVEDTRGAIT